MFDIWVPGVQQEERQLSAGRYHALMEVEGEEQGFAGLDDLF